MTPLDNQQQAARDWFEALRDRICQEFEAIEREAGSDAAFEFIPWDRTDEDGTPGEDGTPREDGTARADRSGNGGVADRRAERKTAANGRR